MSGEFYTLPNDGTSWRCSNCHKSYTKHEIIAVPIPDSHIADSRHHSFGYRLVVEFNIYCLSCVDSDWHKQATYKGCLPN